jgi:hypothetical protein
LILVGNWIVDLQTFHVQSGVQAAANSLADGIKDGSEKIGAGLIEIGAGFSGIGKGLSVIGVGLCIGLIAVGFGFGYSRQERPSPSKYLEIHHSKNKIAFVCT